MSFFPSLFQYLEADATLGPLLTYTNAKTGVSDFGVFHDQAPEDRAKPYVVATSNDESPEYHAGGQCDHEEARWTLDVYGATKATVLQVKARIKDILSGYSSSRNGAMYGLWIDFLHIDGIASIPEGPLYGDDRGLYRESISLRVRYAVTVPSIQ